MAENSRKWKDRLLSSSLPLEYEVSKILSSLKSTVSFDYSYHRNDNGEYKEFSVDIKSFLMFPINGETVEADMNFLVECKYRDEGKVWAFLPEVNEVNFSNQTLGYLVRVFDEFSKRKVKDEKIYSFENNIPFALKGIEIGITNGEVFDKDIRHGISQLKYALPYVIKDSIQSRVFNHIEDAFPFFILPVLVTNADLYVFKPDFSIPKLKNCNSVEDVAAKVPYLILYNESGPDFTEHHKSIFENFGDLKNQSGNLNKLDAAQKKFKDKKFDMYTSPIETCEELEQSSYWILNRNYSHFYVCNISHLKKLLENIIRRIKKSLES